MGALHHICAVLESCCTQHRKHSASQSLLKWFLEERKSKWILFTLLWQQLPLLLSTMACSLLANHCECHECTEHSWTKQMCHGIHECSMTKKNRKHSWDFTELMVTAVFLHEHETRMNSRKFLGYYCPHVYWLYVGCQEVLHSIRNALMIRWHHGLESFVLFIDLVKAYDTIQHEIL